MGRGEDSQFPSHVFVGREPEIAELRAAVDKALRGTGQLFLISGEPGIGKTRLADELSRHAGSHGARVIWGRCSEGSGSPAYWPWIQVVRSCLAALGEERFDLLFNSEARQVTDLLPESNQIQRLSSAATRLRALPSSDPEEARFRLFDSTAQLLKNAASAEPLVIVLDDLQEADHPSLLMLRFVARELKETRVVILGNYREAEVRASPASHRLLEEIAREGHQIALRGLNEAQVARFVQERVGQAAEPGLVGAIMHATAGNPLFLDGVIRMLVAEGKVTHGNRLTTRDLKIPDSVREAIRQRLGLFSRHARALLSIAAVIGQEFEFECLGRVSGDPFDSLLEALDEIQRDGIVNSVDIGHRRYRFSHDLIRETLYEDMPSTRRLQLHQQIAEALEEIYTHDPTPHLAELAHHYRMAAPVGAPAKAIDYSIRAGEAALAIFAYEEAANHWQAALEILEQHGEVDARSADLCFRLGRLMGTIDRAKGIEYLERALRLYKKLGQSIMIAQVHTSLGNFRCMVGAELDVPGAIEHYRKAEAVLRRSGQDDSSARLSAYVNCGLAAAAARAARTREGLTAAHRALDIAERLGDEKIIARAETQLSLHLYYSGRLAEAFTLIDHAWEIADRIDNAKIAFAVTRTGGGCYAALGDPRAYRWYERELSRPRTANTRHARAVLSAVLGECFLLTGQAERVPALMEEMLTDPSSQSQGFVAFMQGQWEDAERYWRQTYERSRHAGGRDEVYGYSPWLAWVLRILGKYNEAETFLTEALSICGEDPLQWVEMWARPELALLFAETGRTKHAEQHLTRCREIMAAGENWRGLAGSAARAEAVAAAANARLDEAELSFQKAVAAYHLGDPLREAETLYSWGRALNTAGEPTRGVEKIEAAIDIYRRSGAGERWIERASAAKPHRIAASPWNPPEPEASFRREGDYWTLAFGGKLFRLKHSKGLDYIAYLLRRAGTELTAVELSNLVDKAWGVPVDNEVADASQSRLDVRSDLGDAGAVLDERAKEDYRRRLRELREELEETERFNDLQRQKRILTEIDAVAAELKAAVGRHGIDRRTASHFERARSTVSKRIRFALKHIRQVDAAAGTHLSESIRTGYKCSYLPKEKIEWEL